MLYEMPITLDQPGSRSDALKRASRIATIPRVSVYRLCTAELLAHLDTYVLQSLPGHCVQHSYLAQLVEAINSQCKVGTWGDFWLINAQHDLCGGNFHLVRCPA